VVNVKLLGVIQTVLSKFRSALHARGPHRKERGVLSTASVAASAQDSPRLEAGGYRPRPRADCGSLWPGCPRILGAMASAVDADCGRGVLTPLLVRLRKRRRSSLGAQVPFKPAGATVEYAKMSGRLSITRC